MKKLGYTIACILVFLVLLTLPSLALASGGSWQQPIPTPAAYGNRVYGYEQATRYWINENGYQLGTSGADLVGRMWSSVFAVPGGPMDTGYTAVTNLDSQTNGINGDSQEYQTVLQDFLEAFNIPYDSTTSSWLVSPAYNTATYGTGSAFSQKSRLVFDVPLSLWVNPPSGTATASGVTLTPPPVATPPYTIGGSGTQNPYPLYVGAAADVGAGYQPDGSVAYWEAYGGPDEWGVLDNGIANMTEQEAVTLYDTYDQGNGSSGVEQDGATTGNVIVSYPFTSELEAIDYASGTVTATVLNPTPYDVIGENWYAYVVPSNQYGEYTGAPTLLTQGTVSIGAQHLGNTTPNQSQFTFTVPASDAGDELIVTLNETMNSDQSVNPEGLPVYYRWGPLANTTAPADNSPKDQIVPLNVWNVTSQGTAFDPSGTPIAYSDNAQSLILPGSSGGGGSTGQPALVIAPDTANILVGNTQQYTDTYFPDGQAAGNGQAVTTASTWSTGNDGVASNYEGDQTGQVYGVAPGTTSVTASYDGLTVTAQVNVAAGVAPSGYNLTVENLESGLSGGTATPGDSYTMTATFTTNTPFTVEGANVWWYINSGNGWQAINSVAQPVTIPTNGSTTASMSWIFPASATSVQLMVTVDDPYVNGSFQPEPIAGTTSMETTYSDNSDQTGVGSNTPPPPQPGPIYRSIGTVTMPVTITPPPVTVEVPHTTWVTTWTPISINNTPKKENWGPPHFYLSY